MSETKETWFCGVCGSLDIRHDAVAQWNPRTKDYDTVAVFDDTWCEDCARGTPPNQLDDDKGEPMWGIPREGRDEPESEADA